MTHFTPFYALFTHLEGQMIALRSYPLSTACVGVAGSRTVLSDWADSKRARPPRDRLS